MSATETPRRRGRPYDPAARRRGVRRTNETGCWCYIPGEVLQAAGFEPNEPPPWYRMWPRAGRLSLAVSLYREP